MEGWASSNVGTCDARLVGRAQSRVRAALRSSLGGAEPVELVDLSTHGCGFRSRADFVAGMRVRLTLPGLEAWSATVVWFGEGRGGLQFVRPLHPGVAARYAG
jgi:PilZ domain